MRDPNECQECGQCYDAEQRVRALKGALNLVTDQLVEALIRVETSEKLRFFAEQEVKALKGGAPCQGK